MTTKSSDTDKNTPSITVSTRLPKDLHENVRTEANKLRVTDSWIIREIVRDYFNHSDHSVLAR